MQELKVIVAGSRSITNGKFIEQEILKYAEALGDDIGMSIVTGMARGVDHIAWQVARHHNIKFYEYPANWDTYGKRAGFLRNIEMVKFADALLCIWDGRSNGSSHMIGQMKKRNKQVTVIQYGT